MFELTFRIEPEQELFRFFSEKKSIMSYCTGQRGLLIYSSPNESNKGILFNRNFIIDQSINVESVQDSTNANILQFNCDCI